MTLTALTGRLPETPPTEAEIEAVLETLPSHTVLSHRSAAQLWGLWIPRFTGIEVTTPAREAGSRYTTSVQRRTLVAHRRRTDPCDVTVLRGIRVTSLARTWMDLVSIGTDLYDVVAAGDCALRLGARRTELLEQCAVRGLRGVRRARSVVDHLDPRSRSRPESRIRAALVLSGLPAPEVNAPILDEYGGWLAEPDLHYREARLALEYNGSDHADLDRMRRDSVRLLGMQRAGWEIRTYTAVHAFRRPDEVVTDVRALLRVRAPDWFARRDRTSSDGRARRSA